jgi:hypothetical protein
VSVENLLYLLLIIRGGKLPSREKNFVVESGKENPFSKLATIDKDGNLIVSVGGQKKIFAHFKDFYVNRIQFEGVVQKKSVKQVTVEITHQPKINKKSAKIAEKHREKIAPGPDVKIETYLLTKD